MNIRWRLVVMGLQVAALVGVPFWILGDVPLDATWFVAGLLAVAINRQLLEPFYSRPGDVAANSVVGVVIWLTADRAPLQSGWSVLLVGLLLAFALALVALIGGANRRVGPGVRVAWAAGQIAQKFTAQVIYSAIFWVSLLSYRGVTPDERALLAALWFGVIAVGSINWQRLWTGVRSSGQFATIEGLVGPARLLVSAADVPRSGSRVEVASAAHNAHGLVAARIQRASDVWAEVQLGSAEEAEALFRARSVNLRSGDPDSTFAGIVDEGSSVTTLSFVSPQELHVGAVVGVSTTVGQVLFQITTARIERKTVKGGSHLVTRATANQLGVLDPSSFHLQQHRWVVPAGALVEVVDAATALGNPPDYLFRLGTVLYTQIPVFLDTRTLCEGHAAILGMTKMGKSTLTHRLAEVIAKSRRTVVFDGTGEYRTKRNVPAYDKETPWTDPSLSVLEPPDGAIRPEFALKCVDSLVKKAGEEYESGDPIPRMLVFEEAHDFFPEPASLGFGAPGREQSYTLGLRMMQIRKYGVSFVLVSQRTAVVSKSALSQCENLIVFRSVDRTGLDYLEEVSGADIRRLIPALRQGEAVVFGPAVTTDGPVAIRVDMPGGTASTL